MQIRLVDVRRFVTKAGITRREYRMTIGLEFFPECMVPLDPLTPQYHNLIEWVKGSIKGQYIVRTFENGGVHLYLESMDDALLMKLSWHEIG